MYVSFQFLAVAEADPVLQLSVHRSRWGEIRIVRGADNPESTGDTTTSHISGTRGIHLETPGHRN